MLVSTSALVLHNLQTIQIRLLESNKEKVQLPLFLLLGWGEGGHSFEAHPGSLCFRYMSQMFFVDISNYLDVSIAKAVDNL